MGNITSSTRNNNKRSTGFRTKKRYSTKRHSGFKGRSIKHTSTANKAKGVFRKPQKKSNAKPTRRVLTRSPDGRGNKKRKPSALQLLKAKVIPTNQPRKKEGNRRKPSLAISLKGFGGRGQKATSGAMKKSIFSLKDNHSKAAGSKKRHGKKKSN